MIYCGIDSGSRFIKVVLIDVNKNILAKKILPTSYEESFKITRLIEEICLESKIEFHQEMPICVTGAGRFFLDTNYYSLSDTNAIAIAVHHLYPSVRTVIDVGAESTSVVRLDKSGYIIDTNINDRCSSGSGVFIETMAKVLEIPIDRLSEYYFLSKNKINISCQCTVFAESEIISLIHSGIDINDIIRAVIDSVAQRVNTLIQRIGVENDILLIGGLSENAGFISSLKEFLGVDKILFTDLSRYVNAYGCAIYLMEKSME